MDARRSPCDSQSRSSPCPAPQEVSQAGEAPHEPLRGSPTSSSPAGQTRPSLAGGSILAIVVALAATFAGLAVVGALPRRRHEDALNLAASAAANSPPIVRIATARVASSDIEQLLPGNTLPLFEAAIYARTNGYLNHRNVDIGDRVKEGELLAQIDTPEIDDQLEQRRATLLQTEANLERDKANEEYGNLELARVQGLLNRKAVSQEEYDRQAAATKVAAANVQATQATIKVNQAEIRRLTDLQAFQKITAPFPGVITVRNYDAGALMIADNPANQLPMFRLARIDTLRVMVSVPQVYSTLIHPGQTADVFRRENSRRQFAGRVTRIANALDPATRTMLTEVQVPNPDGELLPGMYLMVRFHSQTDSPRVIVPSASIVTRADGMRIAVLDRDNRVHYHNVQLGLDFGAETEVTAGLEGGEQVVVHPGDALPEGAVVQIASQSAEPTSAATGTPQPTGAR